ncbi:hypothetical protein BDQ17DRAFT_1505788 [Cyathus striatus]|nr:hypothetical protein BDQ17DRAFT_1505788 [Cyathus striatus]
MTLQELCGLYGPAGAGKSAIAQTTAEECHREGKLAASFFYSRFSQDATQRMVLLRQSPISFVFQFLR